MKLFCFVRTHVPVTIMKDMRKKNTGTIHLIRDVEHEEELQNNCILFVLKEGPRLSYNEFQFTISAGENGPCLP